jgi:hypothetical protein
LSSAAIARVRLLTAPLTGRIPGAAVVPEERHRTGVDDAGAALGDHLRYGRAAGGEHCAQVRVEQFVKLCGVDVEDRRTRRLGDACAIHQDVNAAEFVNAPVHQRFRRRLI